MLLIFVRSIFLVTMGGITMDHLLQKYNDYIRVNYPPLSRTCHYPHSSWSYRCTLRWLPACSLRIRSVALTPPGRTHRCSLTGRITSFSKKDLPEMFGEVVNENVMLLLSRPTMSGTTSVCDWKRLSCGLYGSENPLRNRFQTDLYHLSDRVCAHAIFVHIKNQFPFAEFDTFGFTIIVNIIRCCSNYFTTHLANLRPFPPNMSSF